MNAIGGGVCVKHCRYVCKSMSCGFAGGEKSNLTRTNYRTALTGLTPPPSNDGATAVGRERHRVIAAGDTTHSVVRCIKGDVTQGWMGVCEWLDGWQAGRQALAHAHAQSFTLSSAVNIGRDQSTTSGEKANQKGEHYTVSTTAFGWLKMQPKKG